jgi:hypothetical protein
MNALPPQSQALIGTFRRFGEVGPVYQVTGHAGPRLTGEQMLHIQVTESGEELDYKLNDFLDDPLAD